MPKRRRSRGYRPPQPYPFAVPILPQAPAALSLPPSVSATTLSAKNATVAKVQVSKTSDYSKGPDWIFEAAESAKREQGDRYDQQTGELLALGRALQTIGRQLVSEGNHRVKAMVDEQAAVRAKKDQPKQPVHRRTREEWEEMQREKSREGALQIARNLGLNGEAVTYGHYSVISDQVLPDQCPLANGRYMVVAEQDAVVLYDENDNLLMRFPRQ